MKYFLHLPEDTDTSWYDSATPEEAAEALVLGATLYTTVKSMKAGEAVAALESKQAADLAAVRVAAEERIAAIQRELDAAAADRSAAQQRAAALFETQRNEATSTASAEKERLIAAHAKRLEEVMADLRLQQERYAALEERRKAIEQTRDIDIRVAEDRTKALLQHALDEKERAVIRADNALTALKEAYDRQTEEVRALGDLLRRKQQNVRMKGTEYENEFRDLLVRTFGLADRFSLTDSARSGIGHAGDYLMNHGDHTILWEVKNYDRVVPTGEVEKFRRDMKENPQVRVGVMVSRCSAITGMTASGDRAIEFLDGKMLIYLSNFESMSDDTLANLLLLFRLWWHHDKHMDEEDDDSKIVAIRQIERLHADATKAKTEWRLQKSRMEEALRWTASLVEDYEARLRAALNVLQGSVVSVEVPLGVFRDATGNEKMVLDIQTILRHTVAEVGSSCILNDLADVFAKERGMTASTARTHITAVLLDSALDKAPGRTTKIQGLRLQVAAVAS
jgi:hypothetical protein